MTSRFLTRAKFCHDSPPNGRPKFHVVAPRNRGGINIAQFLRWLLIPVTRTCSNASQFYLK